jgi:hypothetical protein
MRAFLLLLVFLCNASYAVESNLELRSLTQADQLARSGKEIKWELLSAEDRGRREQVRSMLAAGVVKTAEDYYNAALIMQHGQAPDDFRLAFSLATVSATMDPESQGFQPAYKTSKWLKAAAWDRLMMNLNKPQWYGTQFQRKDGSAKWEFYALDEAAVSDDERKSLGVMTREQALAKLAEMNKTSN